MKKKIVSDIKRKSLKNEAYWKERRNGNLQHCFEFVEEIEM